MSDLPNIVLVHGAWADGSSWSAVIEPLQASGYHVTAPQFPMTSLAADVARLRQVLARQDGPAIVAGHSYGGQIITALGADAPNVAGLVYIAAFGLDQGESIGALLSQGPPSPALARLIIDEQGFAWLPEEDFVGHFAADVDPVRARVMWAVQQPLSAAALQEVMGVPAWKSRPSWFLVAAGDQAIPPDAERQFAARMGATTVEVPSNHVAMISHRRTCWPSSRPPLRRAGLGRPGAVTPRPVRNNDYHGTGRGARRPQRREHSDGYVLQPSEQAGQRGERHRLRVPGRG
jgi:pimeloyl-ACP methyl ester carboxylesterase